MASSRYLA